MAADFGKGMQHIDENKALVHRTFTRMQPGDVIIAQGILKVVNEAHHINGFRFDGGISPLECVDHKSQEIPGLARQFFNLLGSYER
jgi:hypothetical protein